MDLGYISPNISKTFTRRNFNYQNKKAFEGSLYSADWSSIDELANTEGPNAAYKPSRTLHHPANLLSSIILYPPFSPPGHFPSHVLQPSHIHHCTTSLE